MTASCKEVFSKQEKVGVRVMVVSKYTTNLKKTRQADASSIGEGCQVAKKYPRDQIKDRCTKMAALKSAGFLVVLFSKHL